MIRITTLISILSIFGYLLVQYVNGPAVLAYVLFGLGAVAIALLLVRAYAVVSSTEGASSARGNYYMRAHILLHLVPSSYLILVLFTKTTLFVNAVYLIPVLLFFLTGRQTWGGLFRQFGGRMYRIFYVGNTGMSVGFPVLLGLGVLYDETFGSVVFCRVLLAYFTIHLLLTGVAVSKIEEDILGNRAAASGSG